MIANNRAISASLEREQATRRELSERNDVLKLNLADTTQKLEIQVDTQQRKTVTERNVRLHARSFISVFCCLLLIVYSSVFLWSVCVSRFLIVVYFSCNRPSLPTRTAS